MTLQEKDFNSVRVYYFGCIGGPGHYMHASKHQPDVSLEDRRHTSAFTEGNPWGYKIDSGLCPGGDKRGYGQRDETQGRALIHHKDNWTALSFWDRSVDTRGACNSNFIATGNLDFEDMVALAKFHFPDVMSRFKFDIVDVTPKEEQKNG